MTVDSAGYFDPDDFRRQGHQLIDLLGDFLRQSIDDSCQNQKVLNYRDPEELLAEWQTFASANPPILEVYRRVLETSIRLHHPRYMGHQISPPAAIAALSGLVADTINCGMGVYEMGQAGTVLERMVIKHTARHLGFNESADGILTSGGSLANLTAMLTARSCKANHDVWQQGTSNQLAVMVSQQAHYCIDRAVRIMGWGDQGMIRVPCDNDFRMRTDLLEPLFRSASQQGSQVVAVVGSACSTATGAYDDLKAIGAFCRDHDLWFHVDGAHGAAVAFSDRYKYLVDGIQQADSVTLDYHKLLLTPALASGLVFRDAAHNYRTFVHNANYLYEEQGAHQWHDLARRTFECTKFMSSLKVFSVLAHYGTAAWDDVVCKLYDVAREFAALVRESEDFELLVDPQSNIVCYRYVGQTERSDQNELNAKIRGILVKRGRFYIVQTTIDDTYWLRSTFGSCLTAREHLVDLLQEIRHIARQLS